MNYESLIEPLRSTRPARSLLFLLVIGIAGSLKIASAQPVQVQLPVTTPWYDTGINVVAGQRLTIIASGWVTYGNFPGMVGNADGLSPLTDPPYPGGPNHVIDNAHTLTVIGKIGGTTDVGSGTPLAATAGRAAGEVGRLYTAVVADTGRLFLGYNDFLNAFGDNSGSFAIQVTIDETTSTANVGIFTAVEINFLSDPNNFYVVQRTADLQTNVWADFTSLIRGTGAAISIFDTTRNQPKEFYRVFSVSAPGSISASDKASNPDYTTNWIDGSNSGSGFGPWQLSTTATSGDAGGFFIGSSAANGNGASGNIDTSNLSWGMYANSGNSATATRPLGIPLAIGKTLSVDMDNGAIDNGGRVGIMLLNGSTPRWTLSILGDDPMYHVDDAVAARNTGIGLTTDGLHVALTLTGSDTYKVDITPVGGNATTTITGTLAGSGGIDAVWLFNSNAGVGSSHDAYFNSLQIAP